MPWKPSQPAMKSHSISCALPPCVKRIFGRCAVRLSAFSLLQHGKSSMGCYLCATQLKVRTRSACGWPARGSGLSRVSPAQMEKINVVSLFSRYEKPTSSLNGRWMRACPCGWVTGDEVYRDDRTLRLRLESHGQAFVVAVTKNEPHWW